MVVEAENAKKRRKTAIFDRPEGGWGCRGGGGCKISGDLGTGTASGSRAHRREILLKSFFF